jgi:PKD repeat protein
MMIELRPNRRVALAGVLALLYSTGCAYQNPVQPSVAGVDPTVPSQMTVSALPASGAQSGATIMARVQNANGVPLPNVIVTFATTRGSVSPVQAATGVNGTASTTLSAADTADVTAAAGAISAHTLVASSSTPATPTPTLPSAFLNVAAGGTTGVPLTFSVSSLVAGATWNWSFGDGATTQTTAFSTSHIYTRAGVYTASVSSGAATGTATITVTDPVVPPPPPAPAAFIASIGCPIPTTTTAACNVAATANGVPLPSSDITRVDWDWGDGQVDINQTSPVKTHVYASAGTYTVFATVTGAPPLGVSMSATTSVAVIVP